MNCFPEGDGDMIVAKWKSLTGHIANVHTFDSELFPRCLHGKLRKKPWLKAGNFVHFLQNIHILFIRQKKTLFFY